MRDKVLEWLDAGGTKLSNTDARVLREVCERRDGWEERLRALPVEGDAPPQRGERSPATPSQDAVALERERARKAKEEARSMRAEARKELQAERARSTVLEGELRAVHQELEQARRLQEETSAATGRETSELGRRLRRAGREIDKLRSDKTGLRSELKEERRRSGELRRRLDEMGREPAPEEPATEAPRVDPRRLGRPRARRRRPLPAPKGRFEDSPETLEEWLAERDTHLLVDGYNVTKAPGGFGDLDLAVQRERLIEEVERLARRKHVQTTIVFDGSEMPPGTARRRRGQVEVQYSKPPADGDDHLVALLADLPPDPVIVVTSDRGLQDRVRELGATVASSPQLLELIR